MIKKVDTTICICEKCGNVWTPKQRDILPKVCSNPGCHSTHWNDKGEIKDDV